MTTATAKRRVPDVDAWLDTIELKAGAHSSAKAGMCFMEAAAYLASQPFSDHPPCVSPAIGAFGRSWNDTLPDDQRQILKPLIPVILNTATTPEDELIRAWMATDWLARTFAPAWLDLAAELSSSAAVATKLRGHAKKLRAIHELTDDAVATAALPIIEAARSAARSAAWSAARSAAESAAESAAWSAAESAAESAAWSAAWSAAESAAESAARSAAESAARSAARSAAESAAWSAAESAAESAAWSAARSAAESAAWSAAWSAARSAAWSAARSAARSAAWSAARSAATEALHPTVLALQDSALDLMRRMAEVGRAKAA